MFSKHKQLLLRSATYISVLLLLIVIVVGSFFFFAVPRFIRASVVQNTDLYNSISIQSETALQNILQLLSIDVSNSEQTNEQIEEIKNRRSQISAIINEIPQTISNLDTGWNVTTEEYYASVKDTLNARKLFLEDLRILLNTFLCVSEKETTLFSTHNDGVSAINSLGENSSLEDYSTIFTNFSTSSTQNLTLLDDIVTCFDAYESGIPETIQNEYTQSKEFLTSLVNISNAIVTASAEDNTQELLTQFELLNNTTTADISILSSENITQFYNDQLQNINTLEAEFLQKESQINSQYQDIKETYRIS